ncbi:MAG: hypothetical protein KDB74_01495 [Flavobacteriales bacterium]|nr:hypothetical protein [Flavobacteriales bacterium]
MANRYLEQFQLSFEKYLCTIYGEFSIGSSGAVTAGTVKGGGVSAVVKESADGQYSITLEDYWGKLVDFDAQIVDSAVSQIAKIQILEDPATLQTDFKADKTFKIQCLSIESDATPQLIAANPASGDQIKFKIVVRNSLEGKFD